MDRSTLCGFLDQGRGFSHDGAREFRQAEDPELSLHSGPERVRAGDAVLRQMQIDAGSCSLLSKETATSLGGNVRATNKPSEWLGVVANAFLCTCDISMGSTRSVPLIEGDL